MGLSCASIPDHGSQHSKNIKGQPCTWNLAKLVSNIVLAYVINNTPKWLDQISLGTASLTHLLQIYYDTPI